MCLYLSKKEKVPVAVPLSTYLFMPKEFKPCRTEDNAFSIPLWIQRARFKDSNYKGKQMRESLNLFRNRFYLF